MTTLIIQTVLIIILSLLAGVLIGIMFTNIQRSRNVNKRKTSDITPDNPTLKMYNNYLSKQPKK